MQLCDLSALEISRLVKSKKASAVEVLESCLERIGQVDGRPGTIESGPITDADRQQVHAFITVTPESALEICAKSRQNDRQWR